jgi:CheY-like chemotaxis protein
VLLTPATRGRIDSFKRLGFRGYLIKPIRAVTLIGLLNEASSAEPSATVAPPPAAPRNAMRFLVGDSESSSAALCKIVLETAGHSVEIVEDCAAAICALSSGRFELAFLDARTLKLDDPKSVAAIRAYCDSGSATPIIVLAAEQRETVEACRKAGILEAFDGPISIEKLEAMVTRRRAGADAEAARIAS